MPEHKIIMSDGQGQPNPALMERFQSVVSSLFQQVCCQQNACRTVLDVFLSLARARTSLRCIPSRSIVRVGRAGAPAQHVLATTHLHAVQAVDMHKHHHAGVCVPLTRVPCDLQRIVRCGGPVDDDMANLLVAQFLYLDSTSPKKDITMYINSPGGSVTAGMAVFDTMRHVRPDVSTMCAGMAASMGAFLLAAGHQGKRYALSNSRIMIHQPLGGAQGQVEDVEIQVGDLLAHGLRCNVARMRAQSMCTRVGFGKMLAWMCKAHTQRAHLHHSL